MLLYPYFFSICQIRLITTFMINYFFKKIHYSYELISPGIQIHYVQTYSCIYEYVYARIKYFVISYYCKFVLKSHERNVLICIIRIAERQTLLERNETILCIFIVVLLAFLLCYLCCCQQLCSVVRDMVYGNLKFSNRRLP